MLKKTLALLLLLCAGQAFARTFPLEIIEYIDDTKVVAFVYEKDVQQSPAWKPADAPPPLDIADVLLKMRDYTTAHPLLAGASFEEAELKRIPHHPDHWHYLVVMKIPGIDRPETHFFVMLMNGKVIPALKEPAPLK